MNERTKHLGVTGVRPIPVQPHQLLAKTNPAASQPLATEGLITHSSRTVLLPEGMSTNLTLKRSEELEGAWRLPRGVQLSPGFPVRRAQVIRARPPFSKGRNHFRLPIVFAESSIPDWLTIGFHPTLSFPGSAAYGRTRKGRRIRLSAANHVNIYNGESRVNIFPNTYPECCVCQVTVFTKEQPNHSWVIRKQGTGFMVGSRILMTSGHMRPPEPYAEAMIMVFPAQYDGGLVFGDFYTFASDLVAYNSDAGDDFMVCRLYDAIGDITGYFGAVSYDSDWEDQCVWSMCGYPADIGFWQPTYEGSIAVIDDDDGDNIALPDGRGFDTTQIETKADSASGASGSPLYSWFSNGEMFAIGAHKGWEEDADITGGDTHSVASGGDGFVELIKWARLAWP